MYKHTCQICGMEFESPSSRAKYCIYCRDKAQVMRNRAYKEKKQAGEAVAMLYLRKALHRDGRLSEIL